MGHLHIYLDKINSRLQEKILRQAQEGNFANDMERIFELYKVEKSIRSG